MMRIVPVMTAVAAFLSTSSAMAVPTACRGTGCKISVAETVSPIKPPDFNDLSRFSSLGESFAYNRATDLFPVSGGASVGYASAFSFHIGGDTTSTLYVKEDGVVSFGRALASGGFTATADLGRLGVPVIAPFYADLNQNSRTAIAAGYPGVVIQQGIADPFADANGGYSLSEARAALRITWYGFDVGTSASAGGTPVFTQLLLVDQGNGDFAVKLRAGAPGSAGANSPAGGIGGVAFGDNLYQFDTPYDSTVSAAFSVRDGEIVQAGAVPEPATWAMMILGLGLAGTSLRYGRARRRRAAAGHGWSAA